MTTAHTLETDRADLDKLVAIRNALDSAYDDGAPMRLVRAISHVFAFLDDGRIEAAGNRARMTLEYAACLAG